MAEPAEPVGNAGDRTDNSPTPFETASIAALNTRIATLTAAIDAMKPAPLLSPGNVLAIASCLVVIVLAALGAWGLGSRIDSVGARVDRAEDRLGGQMEKLNEQFTRVDERTSIVEGRLQANAEAAAKH